MEPKYINEQGKGTKEFREAFQADHTMFEIAVSEIYRDNNHEDVEITTRNIKDKMHELLYAEGMSAFKNRKPTQKGKDFFKENYPEFYGEMVAAEEPAPVKKSAPKKETSQKATTAKKTTSKKDAANKGKANKPSTMYIDPELQEGEKATA